MRVYFMICALAFIMLTGAIRLDEGVAPAGMVVISMFAAFFIIFEMTNSGINRRR